MKSRLHMCKSILNIGKYLNEKNINHRDLKLANFIVINPNIEEVYFINSDDLIKIADFGEV